MTELPSRGFAEDLALDQLNTLAAKAHTFVGTAAGFPAVEAAAIRLGLPDPLDDNELVCARPHQEVPA